MLLDSLWDRGVAVHAEGSDASGAVAVQVVTKAGGEVVGIEHVGSGMLTVSWHCFCGQRVSGCTRGTPR